MTSYRVSVAMAVCMSLAACEWVSRDTGGAPDGVERRTVEIRIPQEPAPPVRTAALDSSDRLAARRMFSAAGAVALDVAGEPHVDVQIVDAHAYEINIHPGKSFDILTTLSNFEDRDLRAGIYLALYDAHRDEGGQAPEDDALYALTLSARSDRMRQIVGPAPRTAGPKTLVMGLFLKAEDGLRRLSQFDLDVNVSPAPGISDRPAAAPATARIRPGLGVEPSSPEEFAPAREAFRPANDL